MGQPFKKNARYEDLYSIPDSWVGEIIDGDLYAFPRPRVIHARAIGRVMRALDPDDADDAAGWVILPEVEIYFGPHLVVPDVSGWRRARLPTVPDIQSFELPPDWVCEGLSPSTARLDRGRKSEIYAQSKVGHVWFVDPGNRTLEVLALDGTSYRVAQTGGDDDKGVFAPFSHEIDLSKLWQR